MTRMMTVGCFKFFRIETYFLTRTESFALSDGTVSIEDKGLEDDSDNDDDILGLLSQDYIVDKQEIPNIEDLDESAVPILAHKDSRNSMKQKIIEEFP